MPLIGIGMKLDSASTQAIIDFKSKWSHVISGPELGYETNVPHLTLYQFPVRYVHEVRSPIYLHSGTAEWSGLDVFKPDWSFAMTTREKWMIDMQSRVIEELSEHLDRSQIDLGKTDGFTLDELIAYDTTGYRYAGPAFAPHVTLGSMSPLDEHLDEVSKDFMETFCGLMISFDEPVLYIAGHRGVFVEAID